MGLTVACARCHDHKFDPIPTTDYYALAGIFRSTRSLFGVDARQQQAGYAGDLSICSRVGRQQRRAEPMPIS